MAGRGAAFTRSIGIGNVVHATDGDGDEPFPWLESAVVGTSRTPWHGSGIAAPRIDEPAGQSTESSVVNTLRKSSSHAVVPRVDHLRRVLEAVRDQWISAERVDRS
ncbi:MAG: hypothetical protein CMJ51_01860 [Planctomycetaceae bacterium]|nr:hypothetical protein [Planctomycetaceae bacterium]